jgi:hypothetical protein
MSNMAIKYNMMKKAKNFAMGGACDEHGDQACPMCHGGKMAEGGDVGSDKKGNGQKGIHPSGQSGMGTSTAGDLATVGKKLKDKGARVYGEEHGGQNATNMAKKLHSDKLTELKSMADQDRTNLAEGGEVEDDLFEGDEDALDMVGHIMKKRAKMFADGGMADDDSGVSEDETKPSRPIVDPAKAKAFSTAFSNYADGGDVVSSIMKRRGNTPGSMANDVGDGFDADAEENQFDDMVQDDHLDDKADETGANSGDEIGDEGEDERRRDIVSAIMRSRKLKDRNPRIT